MRDLQRNEEAFQPAELAGHCTFVMQEAEGIVPIFIPVTHHLLDVTVLGARGWPETSLQAEFET